eukprot:8361376-Pyramimonas_sp.AAC.1
MALATRGRTAGHVSDSTAAVLRAVAAAACAGGVAGDRCHGRRPVRCQHDGHRLAAVPVHAG